MNRPSYGVLGAIACWRRPNPPPPKRRCASAVPTPAQQHQDHQDAPPSASRLGLLRLELADRSRSSAPGWSAASPSRASYCASAIEVFFSRSAGDLLLDGAALVDERAHRRIAGVDRRARPRRARSRGRCRGEAAVAGSPRALVERRVLGQQQPLLLKRLRRPSPSRSRTPRRSTRGRCDRDPRRCR